MELCRAVTYGRRSAHSRRPWIGRRTPASSRLYGAVPGIVRRASPIAADVHPAAEPIWAAASADGRPYRLARFSVTRSRRRTGARSRGCRCSAAASPSGARSGRSRSSHEAQRTSTLSAAALVLKGAHPPADSEIGWPRTPTARSTPRASSSTGELHAPDLDAAREQLRVRGLLADPHRASCPRAARTAPAPSSRRSSRSRSRSSRASSRR